MIISRQKKFVFIHIFKTAGTSVTSQLLPYARLRERITGHYKRTRKIVNRINKIFGLQNAGNTWINGIHKHATAAEMKAYLGADFDRFFKFTFVRNPYDWLVSLYSFVRQSPIHHDHDYTNSVSFKEFMARQIANNAKKQTDFILIDGKVAVDYIGRVEKIDDDMKEICSKVGIPPIRLPRLNPSRRKAYDEYYDDDLRAMVASYFGPDFDMLDYPK